MEKQVLGKVSVENLRRDLFYLCRDPLSFRTVSYTIPWHEKNSLEETDDFIAGEMRKYASYPHFSLFGTHFYVNFSM